MVATLPVQDHLDVLGFDAHDDFAQGRTHDPLPCRRRGRRTRPGELEVDAEPHHLLPLPLAQRRRLPCLDGGDFALDPAHDLQRLVPPPLELAGDQTIRRIHSIVLPACMCGFEARPLQGKLQLSPGG